MAWSHSIRLAYYYEAPDAPGIYEIGFTRGGVFNPQYIGNADNSVRDRLKSHYTGTGNKEVDLYLDLRERDNLWCHWMRVKNPSESESRLLWRYKIGRDKGMYKYNKRYE